MWHRPKLQVLVSLRTGKLEMIISRTALRISLAGGGTDFPDFYRKEGGAVLSTTINKYIYVIVNKSFSDRIHVSYSKKETCNHVDGVKHELVREAMKMVGIKGGIEITTMADVPSEGTGLGSSSALTVGLLNALQMYKTGMPFDKGRVADIACSIELGILGKPIGVQDQYITAWGGLRLFNFHKDGRVSNTVVSTNENKRKQIEEELMLFYTGITRSSSSILQEQKDNIDDRLDTLRRMRDQVLEMKAYMLEGPRTQVGKLLHEGWMLKKQLSGTISNDKIDKLYQKALAAGATGGKISGAGGGGFLLLHVPKEQQQSVRTVLSDLQELEFKFENEGSTILSTEVQRVFGGVLPQPGRWHSGYTIQPGFHKDEYKV